jgi:hypothetical protein
MVVVLRVDGGHHRLRSVARRQPGQQRRILQRGGVEGDRSYGYYGLINYRLNRFQDVGMLYDWSEIPEVGGAHESAVGLLYTRQFSEQVYVRLQLTRGTRPGEGDFNEILFQWTWGMGPHRHNLE